jgi:predicted nucleic acid-binding protein
MPWYLDTSAFLKLVTFEDESTSLRSWFADQDSVWSSQLLRTEASRAALRLGIDAQTIDRALDTVSLILPSVTTFDVAGAIRPAGLRSLDALHLSAALELGDDLEGLVAYDSRMIGAARGLTMEVVSP